MFADKQKYYSYTYGYPGFAWGFVCRLSELFSVKAGHDYQVVVALPYTSDTGCWTAVMSRSMCQTWRSSASIDRLTGR